MTKYYVCEDCKKAIEEYIDTAKVFIMIDKKNGYHQEKLYKRFHYCKDCFQKKFQIDFREVKYKETIKEEDKK